MTALRRGQVVGCSNPLLSIWLQAVPIGNPAPNSGGRLTDPVSLSFIIYDVSTPANLATPLQVFPVLPIVDHPVVIADCPAGGRLKTGHFAADWAVPGGEAFGRHRITWFFSFDGVFVQQYSEDFEILNTAIGPGRNSYALVADLRDEGVASTDATDQRLQTMIQTQSAYIDRVTRRFFNPRECQIDQDGPGTGVLFYEQPIVAIEEVRITIEGISFSDQPIDLNDVAIYNRHITGVMEPDDRDNPKIAFKRADPEFARLHALLGRRIFYQGKNNIRTLGLFGYVDPDPNVVVGAGGAVGQTPELIRHCCKLLVIRNIAPLANTDDRFEALNKGNIKALRTRDQEISYQSRNILGTGMTEGPFTGDTEIDNILMMYGKPPQMRVV